MSRLSQIPGRLVALAVAALLVVTALLVFTGGSGVRTATLHFDRTVSVYPGSEVRVMGVRIGSVTSVVPQGDQVKVEIEYDDQYSLPAGAKAAIITPTLVADRFVQIAPAYTGGAKLADGAEIKLADTATPVELDRIYQSLADLTKALGPDGANKDGALNTLLSAGAKALEGNGALGNETLKNLAAAVDTFGDNAGPLFDSVRNLSQVTQVLSANDAFVSRFMGDLASVSTQLAGERDELAGALTALSNAIGTVRSFVRDNKTLLIKDVRKLTTTVQALARQKKSIDTFARLGALGIQNLNLAYDVKTGTIGSRVQLGPTVNSLDNILCDVVVNSQIKGLDNGAVCALLDTLLKPLTANLPDGSATFPPSQAGLSELLTRQPPSGLLGLVSGGGR